MSCAEKKSDMNIGIGCPRSHLLHTYSMMSYVKINVIKINVTYRLLPSASRPRC